MIEILVGLVHIFIITTVFLLLTVFTLIIFIIIMLSK